MIERNLDVLVIGGGQAGLAMGYHLKQAGHRFQIVERNARIGDSWRNRYDSLVLFTPRAYSALPGLLLPGDPDGYPGKDEVADYLERYASHLDLPVLTETGIRSLTRVDEGFRARTDAGEIIDARAVVLATGAFQRPAIPAISRRLSPDVLQLTPESYKRPGEIPRGRVLVVGDGATGRHIALELAATHEVLLATGRSRRVSPERILGKSVFWWMDMVGILRASRETRVGRYLMEADPFPGKALGLGRLRRQDIRVTGRLFHVDGKRVGFTDGETAEVEPCSGRRGTRTTANRWRSPRSRIDAESLPTEAAYRPCPPSPLLSLSPSFRRSDRSDGSLRADFGERHADLLVNVVSPLPTGNRYLGPVESSGGGVGLRY